MPNYYTIKGEITIDPEIKEHKFEFDSETQMRKLIVTFSIDPEAEWKTGVSQYGPWALIGRMSIENDMGQPIITNEGMFGRYEKEKIVGGGIKIKDWVYLNIYFQKDPTKIVYYFKFDQEKELKVNNKELPF